MNGITALVVDDSKAMRNFIAGQLQKLDYKVLQASNSAEAVVTLYSAEVDVILIDKNMPETSGTVLIRTIRSDSRLQDIPILLVTADTNRNSILQALHAGANEFLTKPFTGEALRSKLELIGCPAGVA